MPLKDVERSPFDWLIEECLAAVRAHGLDMPAVQLHLAEALRRLSKNEAAQLADSVRWLDGDAAASRPTVN